jgi:hypothetical protein
VLTLLSKARHGATVQTMKKFFLLLGLMCFVDAATAMANCALNPSQAPTIRGFKLGMSKQAAEQAFGSRIHIYRSEQSNDTATMSVSGYEYPDRLPNVIKISMDSFDDKITRILVTYAGGAFANHAQAQARFNRDWSLPNAWSAVKYGDSFLVCNGWTMTLRLMGGQPQVEIGVHGIDKQIAERVKQKAAAKFKP